MRRLALVHRSGFRRIIEAMSRSGASTSTRNPLTGFAIGLSTRRAYAPYGRTSHTDSAKSRLPALF
jgi:hypothetical protein